MFASFPLAFFVDEGFQNNSFSRYVGIDFLIFFGIDFGILFRVPFFRFLMQNYTQKDPKNASKAPGLKPPDASRNRFSIRDCFLHLSASIWHRFLHHFIAWGRIRAPFWFRSGVLSRSIPCVSFGISCNRL